MKKCFYYALTLLAGSLIYHGEVMGQYATSISSMVPVEVPWHKNNYCPCFNRLKLAVRLTTSNGLGSDEMQALIAGAQAAARCYNLIIQIGQGASKQTQADDLVGATSEGFRGTIITTLPSPRSPANGALQVAMNSYPNISVIGVMSGQDRASSLGNMLGYIGPNATDSGYQGLKALQSMGGLSSSAYVLCLNPWSGNDEGTDNLCAGARNALKELQPGNGTLEEYIDFDNTRVDTARQAIMRRLKLTPFPNTIISPRSLMSTVLFGVGSTDLVAAMNAQNISVIAVGPTLDTLAGMKQGLVKVVIDHREYFQGYLAVVQAQLFQLANVTLANKYLWTGPTIYTTANLTTQNLMPAFETYVTQRAADFPESGGKSINTLATHASRPNIFWAGWRSGLYQASLDANVKIVEMLTEFTDGDVQAAFLNNVTLENSSVKTDGWIVTFSRAQIYSPLRIAANNGVPIVGVNTRGPTPNIVDQYTPNLLAFVGMNEEQAIFELMRRMQQDNPLATQAICIQQAASLPANLTSRCVPFRQATQLNFTFLPVVITNVDRAIASISDFINSFPNNTRMHIIDGGTACVLLQALQTGNITTGPGSLISLSTFDLTKCKYEAAAKGLINYVVYQHEYVQGYLPVVLHKLYKQTGGALFGHRLLPDKNLGVPYPWVLTMTFLTPQFLSGSFFNCAAASPNSTIVSGPIDITAFPFAESAFPVCGQKVVAPMGQSVFTATWDDGSTKGVIALVTLLAIPILAGMVVLSVKRTTKVIMAMSPTFVICMLIGMLGLDLLALVDIGTPSAYKCALETFLIPVFFALIFGCLIMKNWRVYRIFNNVSRVRMAISDSGLLFGVAMVLAPELTIAIVWVVAAPKYPQLRAVNAEVAAFVCASDLPQVDSVFLGLFYAYNAILLIVCAMLAFLTRNVSDSYSETSMIGYSVYNACGTIIVLVPLLMAGVINNPTVNFWLKAILMIYPTMFGFSILFGERLFFRVWRAETSEAPSETDYSIAMQNGFDVFTHASPSKVLASLENGKELSTRSSSLRGKVTCKNHFSGVSFGLHSCPVIVLNKKSLIARWELRLGVLYDANLIILFHAGRKEPPRVESVIMMLYWNVGRQVNDKENNIYSIELSEREPVNSSKQPSSFPYDGHKERTKWCNLIIDFTSEEHFLKWSSILSHSAEQTNTPTNVPSVVEGASSIRTN